jgi:hypothetical protein
LLRAIALATLVAGTLDIAFAMILTVTFGGKIGNMLRYVGSGPFPAATEMGSAGAIIGLVTHFTLIAVMAAIFVFAAWQRSVLVEKPVTWGILYGLATYFVMNWIVVPLRFDTPLPLRPLSIATQLSAHILLVGIPVALIAARRMRSAAFHRK